MKYNISVDYTENGVDRNRSHIVYGATNETAAGLAVKKEYEELGCVVQSMIVIYGDYTLDQLYDMANYGKGMDEVNYRLLYVSDETMAYFRKVQQDRDELRKLNEEIEKRKSMKKY